MLPIIALVGRPNVGKSTLFNVLTRSRDALVLDMPGMTRDRKYGEGEVADRAYRLVDTGGIGESLDDEVDELTKAQVAEALREADTILFLVDAKTGITTPDEVAAKSLQAYRGKVKLVMNKADNELDQAMSADFYTLGFGEPRAISAKRRSHVFELMADVLADIPEQPTDPALTDERTAIAIIGRPNVGKSTLVNRLLGEERVMVLDRPGTTRDSIYIPFDRRGEAYTLIDTAGVRRRTKVNETAEKFSVLKTLQAMKDADVVVYLFDASEGVASHDLQLIEMIMETGPALVLAFNKWDGLDDYQRQCFERDIEVRLGHLSFARRYSISALHGSGVGNLYKAINEAVENAQQPLSTSRLTDVLIEAVRRHEPPQANNRRIKPRYVHLGGSRPLTFVVHGKQVESLGEDYRRYLINQFRKAYALIGVPLHVKCKNDGNPYKSR